MLSREECLAKTKRIVIKVGTSTITEPDGRLDVEHMQILVNQMAKVAKEGKEILLVTSGAIAAGMEKLGLLRRPSTIPQLQAAASVGQGLLINHYSEMFAKHQMPVGQILLTQFDTMHRQQYINASNAIQELINFKAVPIINENDTTSVDEIRFGDNDTLAALVASLSRADLLLILTDIEGFYDKDPKYGDGELLDEIVAISPELEAAAGGTGTVFASGGMATKIRAGKIATFSQVGMLLANGRKEDVISRCVAGEKIGTFFQPRRKEIGNRKRWIAFGRVTQGSVVVDTGARAAIWDEGKSLLAVGITRCKGEFECGDVIEIIDTDGTVFARGLTNYGSAELERIKGLKISEIPRVLGGEIEAEEVVHRDCMVVFK